MRLGATTTDNPDGITGTITLPGHRTYPFQRSPMTGRICIRIDAATAYAEVAERRIYDACRDGEIPGLPDKSMTGGKWLIPIDGLDAWLRAQWSEPDTTEDAITVAAAR